MERGWDRAHPFRSLSLTDAERFARIVEPAARVSAVVPLTAGLRNSNHRIDLADGERLVLRRYTADPSACAREAALLRVLAGHVPVPGVLLSDPSAEPPFSILEWLEGAPLDEALGSAALNGERAREIAFACGFGLAAIHSIRFPAPGFFGPDLTVETRMPSWAPAVLETLALVEDRIGADLAAGVREAVESNGASVAAVWSEAVLVHADFKPWNLLGRARGEPPVFALTGVLDWEFACSGCRLIDFGTFLRDERSRAAGFGDAFASGYVAGGGSLPDDWRRLATFVDLLSLLQLASHHAGRGLDDVRRLVGQALGRRD